MSSQKLSPPDEKMIRQAYHQINWVLAKAEVQAAGPAAPPDELVQLIGRLAIVSDMLEKILAEQKAAAPAPASSIITIARVSL